MSMLKKVEYRLIWLNIVLQLLNYVKPHSTILNDIHPYSTTFNFS
jgi:hypothetical protein